MLSGSVHGALAKIVRWLRARDAGLSALRRSARAAIVMPALFALCEEVIGNPTMALFAAFGSLSMLLFADFTGPMRERLSAQAGLVLTGAVLVSLATLASRSTWLAAASMFVVAFVVLFAGSVSSVLAGATTALLASFILPVSLPGPVDAIPSRLAGWGLAGAVSLFAIAGMWPAPTREPLRQATARACALLARRLRAEVCAMGEGFAPDPRAALDAATAAASQAVAALRASFFGTPYRPTGLTTAARTLVRVVDQVVWLEAILARTPVDRRPEAADRAVGEVEMAAAALLERGAALLETIPDDGAHQLDEDRGRMREACHRLRGQATSALPAARTGASPQGPSGDADTGLVSALEPSFRAQELSVATAAIAANIELTVAARRRSFADQVLGRRPDGLGSAVEAAQERAGAQAARQSVWLHNSVRGAIALGLAVLAAGLARVDHSFWVVFGTLAVLRSNALGTGQNALRAVWGTAMGIVVGGGFILAVGADPAVLWALLPLAVALTGLAPAAISFAAGQAGFTATLLIIFNIIAPGGWEIGLIRIEDVALGCAVSVLAGTLFWPRGAGPALGRAVGEALSDSARYLGGAIAFGVSRCDPAATPREEPRDERRRAAGTARRLDNAFRQFLGEGGTKTVPLADVTALITGVAVLRLTADAVLDLWSGDDDAPAGDRAAARAEILAAAGRLVDWYDATARALTGSGAVPDGLPDDEVADRRLLDAVRRDLAGQDGRATMTAVKVIWTADHLDAARRLQAALIGPARAAAAAAGSAQP